MRIAIAQLNLCVGNISANTAHIEQAIIQASEQQQADTVIFPELAITAYPPEDLLFRHADFIQQSDAALEQLCQLTQQYPITAIIGAPRLQEEQLFNIACVLQNGKIQYEYAKQHLPNYRVFDEMRYFTAGQNVGLIEIAGTKMGLLICEDIWQEQPIIEAKKAGAECIIVINASPFRVNKQQERIALCAKRARSVGLPLVYVNLVGGQDELVFDGCSMAFDAQGEQVFAAPMFEAGVFPVTMPLVATPEPATVFTPETFPSEEAQIYDALVLGVRDYVQKNGFRGALLGLSGGIDSALTLAIAVDALGADNVEAIMMPFRYTSTMSVEDARQEAETLGIKYREIPIEPIFDSFMNALAEEFSGLERDVTEENIQARTRGVLLMAMSNKLGKMLLATGNKSEMSVGYATLYGDMSGGFAPLKDVLKTMVYRLSRYRNSLGEELIPVRVIEREPSAELAPDQKDADSLPPYDVLDAILQAFIEEDHSLNDIIARGYDTETVRRVANMVLLNEYKRRQGAPGVRISGRAFGKDRRYPITSAFRKQL